MEEKELLKNKQKYIEEFNELEASVGLLQEMSLYHNNDLEKLKSYTYEYLKNITKEETLDLSAYLVSFNENQNDINVIKTVYRLKMLDSFYQKVETFYENAYEKITQKYAIISPLIANNFSFFMKGKEYKEEMLKECTFLDKQYQNGIVEKVNQFKAEYDYFNDKKAMDDFLANKEEYLKFINYICDTNFTLEADTENSKIDEIHQKIYELELKNSSIEKIKERNNYYQNEIDKLKHDEEGKLNEGQMHYLKLECTYDEFEDFKNRIEKFNTISLSQLKAEMNKYHWHRMNKEQKEAYVQLLDKIEKILNSDTKRAIELINENSRIKNIRKPD